MTKRKKYLSEKAKRHNQDRRDAIELKNLGIIQHPMDLPSLYRAVYGDGKPAFLSTGHDWIDKPHRVANDAMEEIRLLRTYILSHACD